MIVVDDDVVFQELLKQFFGRRGWEVFTADNAEDGIRLFRRHHPEAALLDVHLGDGRRDGISLCDQIRDDISSDRTAILMLSAHQRSAKAQLKGGAVGADSYILKPVQLAVLEERLNEAIAKKSGT